MKSRSSLWGKINRQTIVIGLVSFLMNLSSSMIISKAMDFSVFMGAEASIIVFGRQIGEGAGYFGRFIIGFLSDVAGDRRKFLLLGYGAMLIIKPIFVLCTLDFIANDYRIFLYTSANASEKFFGSMRDPIRDAWLADYTKTSDLSINIAFRRMLSYSGSVLGALISFFISKKLNYTTLFTIAVFPIFLGVGLLYKYAHNQANLKPSCDKRVFISSFVNDIKEKRLVIPVLLILISVFLLFMGKITEFSLWFAGKKMNIEASNSLLYIIYYISSLIGSFIVSFLMERLSPYLIMIFAAFFLGVLNIFISNGFSYFLLIFATVYYGIFAAFIDILTTCIMLGNFKDTNWKASGISVLNFTIGMACSLGGFINNYLIKKYGIIQPFCISYFPIGLGIVVLIIAYLLNLSRLKNQK